MESRNFEFVRSRRPELATLAAFAEHYATSDPSSAIIKLRILAEQVVNTIYDEERLPKPYNAGLNDLLLEPAFTDLAPLVVQQKIHNLRKQGNRAAHGAQTSTENAHRLLREAFDVIGWFHLTFDDGAKGDLPDFSVLRFVQTTQEPAVAYAAQAKALQDKLAQQEAQLQSLLETLERERKEREKLERATETEREEAQKAATRSADALAFSEAQTRQFLIDTMLIEAGWTVTGSNSEQVGQEVELTGLPTTSGKGYADYVLWGDDGKPLAVIEAKKTAKSSQQGRTQVQQYADALERKHGRRPVMFYTNGIDVYIWDDAQGFPPRKIYGIYSKDSLEYLHFQREQKQTLELMNPNPDIAGRPYQLEAVRSVTERFADRHRKALLVQATGTGKTRVAISICELLVRARWVKRILFLCDRLELRKQANNAFKEFLPTEPRTVVSSHTASDREKRIYLATYPAMMQVYDAFDVGFFDLIIADESHRSIYNKYRDLFRYFDAMQVGLTATPVRLLDRNTYGLFGCEDQDPTFNYSLDEAINSSPPYLVPFRVVKVTSKFQRDGIKYSQMTDEQRRQLEQQVEDAETVEHESSDLDKRIFNRDTTRNIIRNLMENGIRDAAGSLPGKTIVFARNHNHAEHLQEIFYDMYPNYGGHFCRVIDNYDAHASQLIDDFKDPLNALRIAISVDMLDTGIDVPEVVNLVFAKPVKSYVKFWQMIGRGTRLCAGLFGPGQDKTEFLIFDHWGNFEYFDEHYQETLPPPQKSLQQRVFDARVALAKTALDKMDEVVFQLAIRLIEADINGLKEAKSIEVRDHWYDLQELGRLDTLEAFSADTHARLLSTAAPLMRWVDVRGHEDAYRFDELMTNLEIERLLGSGQYDDLRGEVLNAVDALQKNLNQVKSKAETIRRLQEPAFWDDATVPQLDEVRTELRGIMKYRVRLTPLRSSVRIIDVIDQEEERADHVPTFDGHDLIAYRQRVESVLKKHFENDPVLQRIRAGHAVSETDLEKLAGMVIHIDPQIDLKHLPVHIGVKGDLHRALRSIIGLDVEAVDAAFNGFHRKHLELTAQQVRFIRMLKNHICINGGLEIDRLYEAPFTTLSADGIDGVFGEAMIDELLGLVGQFEMSDVRSAS